MFERMKSGLLLILFGLIVGVVSLELIRENAVILGILGACWGIAMIFGGIFASLASIPEETSLYSPREDNSKGDLGKR